MYLWLCINIMHNIMHLYQLLIQLKQLAFVFCPQASLEERLTLSESLVNRHNDAVKSTSEQLLKANQIISKQNADLIEMKEKVIYFTL